MNLITIKLDEYKDHPQNRNGHPDNQVEQLGNSLAEFGQPKNIVVWRGFYLAGHGLAKAARAQGLETLEAEDVSEWDEKKAKAFMIADNRLPELAVMDEAKLLADLLEFDEPTDIPGVEPEFMDELLAEFGAETGGQGGQGGDDGRQVDRAEELRQEWKTETGQLWALGEHRLICGDCTDEAVVGSVMGGEKSQLIFTDPPYMTFASSTGKLEPSDFNMIAPFWEKIIKIMVKNLDKGRGMFICCDWRSYPTLFAQCFRFASIKNLIVWDMVGALKLGSHFRPSYELLVYALNIKKGQIWAKGNKGAWKIKDRSIRDLWSIRQLEAAPGKNRDHASQKPIGLAENAITHCSNTKELVLDLFLGSGTTIIACQNLGRRCKGMEINPGNVAVTLQRFKDATGIEPILLDPP